MTAALNVWLPADYLAFLESHGADLAEDPIHDEGLLKGLGSADFMVGTTLSFRSMFPALPNHFIVIGYAGTRLIEKITQPVDVYWMLDVRDSSVHTIDVLGKRRALGVVFERWIASSLAKIRLQKKYGSHVLVIVFEDATRAEQLRAELKRLESRRLIHLKDTVVAERNREGTLKFRRRSGSFLKGLIGDWSHFGVDPGLDRDFVADVAEALHPETSALFVLIRKSRPAELVRAIRGFGGKILLSSIAEEKEKLLQAVLDGKEESLASSKEHKKDPFFTGS